jgi:hypothetical protein
VEFRIVDALMRLASRGSRGEPTRIDGIPVNARFARLYVLHAASRSPSAEDGSAIARYEVNYEDGSAAAVHVVYGEELRDWWTIDRGMPVPRGTLAWTGSNPSARRAGKSLRLYLTMWENPHPDRKVLSINYVSTLARSAPFCVAMTVEQAAMDKQAPKPGGRPDASEADRDQVESGSGSNRGQAPSPDVVRLLLRFGLVVRGRETARARALMRRSAGEKVGSIRGPASAVGAGTEQQIGGGPGAAGPRARRRPELGLSHEWWARRRFSRRPGAKAATRR